MPGVPFVLFPDIQQVGIVGHIGHGNARKAWSAEHEMKV
jgi:hypothetical protein